MEAAKPALSKSITAKDKILADLKVSFNDILIKHLDDRSYNESKIKTWVENILSDAKEVATKSYPDYDIFLYCFIAQRNVYFNSNERHISITETDGSDYANFKNDNIYCTLKYFAFKHYKLDYSLNAFDSDIVSKGNKLMIKYLEDRKYNNEKNDNYINNINIEHIDYILKINNKLRCITTTYIFQSPIKGKYYFNYLVSGKDICKTLFQSYQNDSLLCTHTTFFFK